MSAEFSATLEKYIWQPEIDGRVHDVPVKVMITDGALDPETPQTHLYLGMGEGKCASRAGLKALGAMGIAGTAVMLPFHHLPCDPVNIERTIVEVPHAIIGEMNQRAGRDEPVSFLGHSQGGGVGLISASEAPELFDHVGIWSPVGLTAEAFGEDASEKRREFLKRLLIKNLVQKEQNPVLHPGNLVAGSEVLGLIIADALKGRLPSKLDYALNLDGMARLEKLLGAGLNVRIFGGETDPLFRVEEYQKALGAVGLAHLFHTVPGSHTSPLVSVGREQLEAVGNWLIESRQSAA